MPKKDKTSTIDAPSGFARRRIPWEILLFVILVFGTVTMVCILILPRYLKQSPVNFRENSIALANKLEDGLIKNGIPEENIHRGAPRIEQNEEALWCLVPFDVSLPESDKPTAADATVRFIERSMLPYNVTTALVIQKDFERQLELSADGRSFATVSLQWTAPVVVSQKDDEATTAKAVSDLTQTFQEIVDAIETVLYAQGITPIDIEREDPKIQKDDQNVWSYTQLKAPFPASCTIQNLDSLIRNALQRENGDNPHVSTRLGTQGTITMTVSYAGKKCADIVFLRMRPLDLASDMPPSKFPELRRLNPHAFDTVSQSDIEDLPLDSTGLSDIELGREIETIQVQRNGTTPLRVAIIVDDGGHGGETTEMILGLDSGLTLSILPDTLFNTSTALRGTELGFEIMLHMPCENAGPVRQLRVDMTSEKMLEFFEDALAQVPGAVGVNNHMGSRFTANEKAMALFCDIIADSSLYFIDSRTTGRSKAFASAKKCGIRTAARDVFLDNETTFEYIQKQFNHLVAVTKAQGQAIGICHFRRGTAKALAILLPRLKQNDIELVHVSELFP